MAVSPNIHVMQQAARRAARNLVRDFAEVENLRITMKKPGDFVSVADLRTEQSLIEDLRAARPDHGFLTEEGQTEQAVAGGRRWIIDPIDGTTNFIHGLPHFAISIGLEEKGRLLAGLIYQPITDEMFWAERGKGAFLNNRRIRVGERINLEDSLVGTGFPHIGSPGAAQFNKELNHFAPQVTGIRRMGAASLDLAYVACGRLDMYWERHLAAWDIAAGVIIVREAGGNVTTPEGGEKMLESGDVLAANMTLHQKSRQVFQELAKS